MEIVFCEIHNARTVLERNIGLADIPLVRNGPIEDLGSRGNFINDERNKTLKDLERLARAISSDAATNWKELLDQSHHGFPVSLTARRPVVEWRSFKSHVSLILHSLAPRVTKQRHRA